MERSLRRRLTLALLTFGVFATATVAHAASLDINAGALASFDDAQRCSTDVVQLTAGAVSSGSATSVVLTIPDGCHGQSGKLRLFGIAGPLAPTDTTFTLPASGTTASITVPSYAPAYVTGVALVLNTWGMPTGWSYGNPSIPTITCTTNTADRPCVATILQVVPVSGGYDVGVRVADARTNGNNPVTWWVDMNFGAAVFPFVPLALSSAGPVEVDSSCAEMPLAQVSGIGSFGQLRRDDVREFTLQARSGGSGSLLTCSAS